MGIFLNIFNLYLYMFHVCQLSNTLEKYNPISNILDTTWIEIYNTSDIHKNIINNAKIQQLPYIIICNNQLILNNDKFEDNFIRLLCVLESSNDWDIFLSSPIVDTSITKNDITIVNPYPLILKFNSTFNIEHNLINGFVIYNSSSYDKILNNSVDDIKYITCIDYLAIGDSKQLQSCLYLKNLCKIDYIDVDLYGGLGNQMFQLATAFAIAQKYHLPMTFTKINLIPCPVRNVNEYWDSFLSFFTLSISNVNTHKMIITEEKAYTYQIINKLTNIPITLNGYWQNIQYFNHCRTDIKNLFRPSQDNLTYLYKKYDWLNNPNIIKVMLHIRRGDYNSSIHIPMTYYHKCLQQISNTISYKTIAFSDDINYVKHNLPHLDHYIINESDYMELIMMTHANYMIIANSTFSWWGAYLNKNDDATIFIPKQWTGSGADNFTLPNWIQLE